MIPEYSLNPEDCKRNSYSAWWRRTPWGSAVIFDRPGRRTNQEILEDDFKQFVKYNVHPQCPKGLLLYRRDGVRLGRLMQKQRDASDPSDRRLLEDRKLYSRLKQNRSLYRKAFQQYNWDGEHDHILDAMQKESGSLRK